MNSPNKWQTNASKQCLRATVLQDKVKRRKTFEVEDRASLPAESAFTV